jgi:endonuclease/exonuclease/phosphatase family metal-dependent hydrolase
MLDQTPDDVMKALRRIGRMKTIRNSRLIANLRDAQTVYERHDGAGDSADLVVASYNIHKCVGTDGRFDPMRTAAVIDELGADIVAIQEADRRFGTRDGLLDLLHIEEKLGLSHVPVASHATGHGWHGNALLYREGAVRDIQKLKLPGAEPRGAIVVDLEVKGGVLRVIAAHLGLLRHSRKRQIETLIAEVSECGTKPTLILGDLNEWRLGRRSSLTRLPASFGPSEALPSFPARYPVLALDRIFGTPESLVAKLEVHDSELARIASDHRPIKAFIDMKPVARQAERNSADQAA